MFLVEVVYSTTTNMPSGYVRRLLIMRAACCRVRTWRWRRTETWEITWWEQVPTRRHGINTRRYYALANWFCGFDVQQRLFSKHQLFPLIHWELELSLVLAFGRIYRTIIETNHNYHQILLQKRTSDRTFHRLKLHSICRNNQIIGATIQAKILRIMSELVQWRFKYSIHFPWFIRNYVICLKKRHYVSCFPRYKRAFPILHWFIAIYFALLRKPCRFKSTNGVIKWTKTLFQKVSHNSPPPHVQKPVCLCESFKT